MICSFDHRGSYHHHEMFAEFGGAPGNCKMTIGQLLSLTPSFKKVDCTPARRIFLLPVHGSKRAKGRVQRSRQPRPTGTQFQSARSRSRSPSSGWVVAVGLRGTARDKSVADCLSPPAHY